jgi:hypothetical protein
MSRFVAPIRRHDTAKGHSYKDATGARVPGVTTIIGNGLPKPSLINWAGNATADAAINQWDELTTLPPAARLKRLKDARYEDKDRAGKRGTEVHGYAEQLAKGEPVQVPDELVGHVESYAKFLEEFDVHPVHIEFSVASYKHGYAGTGDLIADLIVNGKRKLLLIDVKTNRTGIFPETALQTAGYRYADVLIQGNNERPMPEVDGCAAIWVRSDGYSLIPLTAGPDQFRTFLYVSEVAKFQHDASDVVGPPIKPPTASTYRLTRQEQNA